MERRLVADGSWSRFHRERARSYRSARVDSGCSFSAVGAVKAETQNCKQWAVSSPLGDTYARCPLVI